MITTPLLRTVGRQNRAVYPSVLAGTRSRTPSTATLYATRLSCRSYSYKTPADSNDDFPGHNQSTTSSTTGGYTSSTYKTSNPGAGSTASGQEPPIVEEFVVIEEKPSRLGRLLLALMVGGIGLTAYGLGEIWGAMTIWPKEVRSDLRQGLLENAHGDRTISAQYLTRAWDHTRQMPIDRFGLHPYLKTTGIGIALAAVYEADGKLEQAYQVYQQTLHLLESNSGSTPALNGSRIRQELSPPERMRAVALSFKLGELAEVLKKPREEEKWLTYSVETVLKDVMGSAEVIIDGKDSNDVEEQRTVVETLQLPKWASKHDIAAPFEALGSFYSKENKVSYAMPLFLQAISILMPPAPAKAAVDDQCRAAQLMGNISELILRARNDVESLGQAEAWANKSLDIATRARKSTLTTHPVCEVSYAFMLYNLAMICDMSGDQSKARQLFHESLAQSRAIGLQEGIDNAEKAIRELGQGGTATVSSLLPNAIP